MLAIETLLDFEALTIEEVTGRLKAVQDRKEAPHIDLVVVGGKLLYTVEQWRALEEKSKKEEGFGLSKERRWRPRGGKKGKPKADHASGDGGGQGGKANATDGERKATCDDTYLNCGRTGHWAKDCRLPERDRGGTTHVVQAEEDGEPTLFLAHGFLELEAEESRGKAQASTFCTSSTTSNLHIDEP